MAFTQYTNLDFEEIKVSLREYLRANSNFTDFDFEGSNLSVLIDTLAYNTYVTAYNTNMVANESFIDSATLRENVVALARNVGYVPSSRRASTANVSFTVDLGSGTTKSSVTLKAGLVALGDFANTNYTFCTPEDITSPVNDGFAEFTIDIKQGTFVTNEFVVDTSQPNQKFIIPNPYVDTSTLKVQVRDTLTSSSRKTYSQIDNIVGISTHSETFLIQEVQDEKYELLFGDGVLGKRLSNGNVINSTYIVTDGVNGNGVANFSFSGKLVDNDGGLITSGISDIITNQRSSNGAEVESIDTIRNLSPRVYSAQHRAVTANDYEAIIPTIFPNVESVTAYGGEDSNPPQFGKVFLSIKPKNGRFISDFDKRQLLDKLKSYSVAGIRQEFIDLKFLFVEIDTNVYYNTNAVANVNNLKTTIRNSLEIYANSSDLNSFGSRFKYSKVLKIIDDSSSAVTSNITKIIIRRNLDVDTANFAQYELCFGNKFHNRNKGYNIKSTGFTVDGIRGVLYFTDTYVDEKTGRLIIFRLSNTGAVEIVNSNAGTVKYDIGEILIDTIRILSTIKADNVVEIEAIPDSNDVIGLKDLYLQLSISDSKINCVEDIISTGADTSGANYISTSSFTNGSKVRGDIITDAASSSTLVGYVNGQAYFGAFHTMSDGSKMTGSTHSSDSQPISSTPGTTSSSSTTTSSSSTSYRSSSSSSSSSSSY